MKTFQGVTYQIRYESVPELAPNAVSVVDLNADSMSQFYSIRRPSSIEIMVEEEPLPPTERFDSPFIGHRVLLPSGQQELVSSLRCIFPSCIIHTTEGFESCTRIGGRKLGHSPCRRKMQVQTFPKLDKKFKEIFFFWF